MQDVFKWVADACTLHVNKERNWLVRVNLPMIHYILHIAETHKLCLAKTTVAFDRRKSDARVTLEWRSKYSLTIVCVTPSWSSWTRWSSATRLRQREVKSLATNFQPPLYRGQLWRLFIFRVWRRATPASRSATTRTLSKVTTTRRSASSSPVIPSLAGEPTTAAMKRGLYDINHSTKNILNVYNHTVL